MKSSTPKQVKSIRTTEGFTLVESMVAILIFGFLSLGVSVMTVQAMKIAHQNVYKTAAYSVMQGFMEQIKSLDNEELQHLASVSVGGSPSASQMLHTRSISLLNEGYEFDEIDDWLVPNTLSPGTLSDEFEVVNLKRVVIDVDNDTEEPTYMDVWVDVEVHRLPDTPGEVYLIDLQFIYDLPLIGGGSDQNMTVYSRKDTRDYELVSDTITHVPQRNEGRMQLVTSLLNIDTL